MKIAIIVRSMVTPGGVERQAMMLAKELGRQGHTVVIYTYAYDKDVCFPGMFDDLRVVSLPGEKVVRSRLARIRGLGALLYEWEDHRRARALARVIDPDTDILNPHEHASARVSYYFKRLVKSVPAVLMLSDLHLASWSLFDDPLFKLPKRSLFQRFIAKLRDLYENQFFLSAQERIVVLNWRTADLVKRFLGRRADVIRSGVDADFFPYHKREGIEGKNVRILCNAIFYVHRRFEDVIAALPELIAQGFAPTLRIVGSYDHKDTAIEYHRKLLTLIHDLNLTGRVEFLGRVSDQQLLEEYKNADVFVFASHMQTWGIAVFEAMVSGIPTIVSSTTGAAEVLTEGEHVLVGVPGDPHSYATAILRLAEDKVLYQRISRGGRKYVEEAITWKKYGQRMADLFEETLAAKL